MPTGSQLDIILESQMEYFGGFGLPKQNFEGNTDGYGLTDTKLSEAPLSGHNSFFNFKGEVIGEIVVDPSTKELEIKVKI